MTVDVSLGIGIAAALVLVGLALLVAAAWQLRWARRVRSIGQQLAACRPDHPTDWPRQAATLLQRAGVTGLHWEGEWMGTRVQGAWGDERHPSHWHTTLHEADGDIHIELRARWRHDRGEAASLSALACEWFALQWRALARQHAAQIDAALRQRAQQTLTLLHDVRNFAQWALWTAEALQAASGDDGHLLQQAQQLAATAPVIRVRAHALLARTRGQDHDATRAPPADLSALLRNIAALHGLTIDVQGTADSRTPLAVWLTVLDNLVVNAAQHRDPGQPPPQATWEPCAFGATAGARLRFALPGAPTPSSPESWFAPLATTRADGSGLGLYLVRRAVRSAGGDVRVQCPPLTFVVELP
ncbi:ATP-binding protein [Tepidimonas taiwanensis]|uniref:ATP-binding protein n=1 Tax=Tepidimonas taiwanensis TaxID=307486 RepID=UPI000734596B|nr:ATP-binding protein [Tepidimonas taiwanensis]